MEGGWAVMLAFLFLVTQMPNVMPSPATVPAFLWSPHNYGSSQSFVNEVVDYRTLTPKELAKSVLSEGGWSNLVCFGKNGGQNVDVALVYVGRKLQSSDISKAEHTDRTLLNLLKTSFTSSNVSVAFPYVDMSDGKSTLENSIISGFVENCGNGLEVNHVAYLDACSLEGKNFKKLQGLQSFEDFIGSRMENGASEKTDLIVLCDEDSQELDQIQSEGKTLSAIVNFLEKIGAMYSVLYASDMHMRLQYPSHLAMRLLAEDNTYSNFAFCDGVCQIKSSLLEGLFVGICCL